MSKQNTMDELAILAAAGGKGGSSQDRLASLLEMKIAKEMQEEQDAKAQAEASRKASLESARQARELMTLQQEQCPHMKPNFRPAIGGQKDHKGNLHAICQYCGKEFGNNLPFHLRIPAEMIGGPQ